MQTEDMLERVEGLTNNFNIRSIEDVVELRDLLLKELSSIWDESENLSVEEDALLENEVLYNGGRAH